MAHVHPGRPCVVMFAGCAAAALACTGQIGASAVDPVPEGHITADRPVDRAASAPSPPGSAVLPGAPAPPDPGACGAGRAIAAPPARVWRLSDAQYANTVRDLFVGLSFVPVLQTGAQFEFVNESELLKVDDAAAFQYMNTAAQVAAAADIAALAPCAAGQDAAACARRFIAAFAPRAFRRPISAEEESDLLTVFEAGRKGATNGGQAAGIQLVIQAALESPSFLYRSELGPRGASGTMMLTPHEIASSLSYLFLDSMPDQGLSEAAATGQLAEAAVQAAQVERLMTLPRVRDRLTELFMTWLGLGKLDKADKDPKLGVFDRSLASSMLGTTRRWLGTLLWQKDGSLQDLLTSTQFEVDERLASYFGATKPKPGETAQVTDTRRPGILGQPSLQTLLASPSDTSVVHRGLFVFKKLLCGSVAPPPPNVDISSVAKGSTERSRAEERARAGGCANCHALIDPLGLAMEQFDPLGRFRQADASATIAGRGDLDGRLTQLSDLTDRLARSADLVTCLSGQMLSFALGRNDPDVCAVKAVAEQVAARQGKVRELFRSLAASPVVLSRKF